ncbi:hypothetical protein [Zhihengliuella halotolerans]|uniref:hypothetical protein n=1 Tax=Zhihengliuella halotolerans TaxID=370736 RepID=UPI000C80967D|nr:hypothetical protein [Zhihengliuella halotolerans]
MTTTTALPSLTTTRGRIERAERALRTGQPGLAMTYMRAARDQLLSDRIARVAPAARPFAIFAEACRLIMEAAVDSGRMARLAARKEQTS